MAESHLCNLDPALLLSFNLKTLPGGQRGLYFHFSGRELEPGVARDLPKVLEPPQLGWGGAQGGGRGHAENAVSRATQPARQCQGERTEGSMLLPALRYQLCIADSEGQPRSLQTARAKKGCFLTSSAVLAEKEPEQ